jgi:predicted transposase/invertase (TIGR01784 family)
MAKKVSKAKATKPKAGVQIHDNFFKTAFSMREVMEDYVRQFLPKNIIDGIDFESLEQDNTQYATAHIKSFESDVVWNCLFGNQKTKAKIAFLIEHKSYQSQYPHLQLMRYMLEIWQINESNNEALTPIIPIIIYHNKEGRAWKSKPFWEYFLEIDENLKQFIPQFEYHLTDITKLSFEDILSMEIRLLANTLLSLRFGSDAEWILQHVQTLFSGAYDENNAYQMNFFATQFVYLIKNNELSDENIDIILENIPNNINMTGYDRIIQRGINLGRQEGLQEGRQEEASVKDETFAKSLIVSTDFEDTKISDLVGVTVEYVKQLRMTLKK